MHDVQRDHVYAASGPHDVFQRVALIAIAWGSIPGGRNSFSRGRLLRHAQLKFLQVLRGSSMNFYRNFSFLCC